MVYLEDLGLFVHRFEYFWLDLVESVYLGELPDVWQAQTDLF